MQKSLGKLNRSVSECEDKHKEYIQLFERHYTRLLGKGGWTINKMLSILAVIFLLNLGFPVDSNAAARMFEWAATTSETIDLLGSPVINPAGKMLGTINAFVNDSEGHVAFVILWQYVLEDFKAARYVAVPFSTLSISGKEPKPTQKTVVFNIDKGKLQSAPSFEKTKDLNNAEWAASIYRYFGQLPYWAEEEAGNAGPATNSSGRLWS